MYKIILLGVPLTGKTSVTNYLRDNMSLEVLDMDEELKRLNDGQWPGEQLELMDKLIYQIIADVLSRQKIVFSGFFFGIEELKEARRKNFEVVQLKLDMGTTLARNKERMKEQPGNDAFKYYKKNSEYQNKIYELDLVDRVIDGSRPVEDTARELVKQ